MKGKKAKELGSGQICKNQKCTCQRFSSKESVQSCSSVYMGPGKKGRAIGSHCQHVFFVVVVTSNQMQSKWPQIKTSSVGKSNQNHCLFKKENKVLTMASGTNCGINLRKIRHASLLGLATA